MRRLRLFLLVVLYLLLALYAARAAVPAEENGATYLLSASMTLVAVMACIIDARVLGRPLAHGAQLALLLAAPVAVPSNLLWSRGNRGLLVLPAQAALLFCAYMAGLVAVTLLMGVARLVR
jgi:hypothetical protein